MLGDHQIQLTVRNNDISKRIVVLGFGKVAFIIFLTFLLGLLLSHKVHRNYVQKAGNKRDREILVNKTDLTV